MYSWVARMAVEILRELGGSAEVVPSRRNPPWYAVRLRVPGQDVVWTVDDYDKLVSMIHRQLMEWKRRNESCGGEDEGEKE